MLTISSSARFSPAALKFITHSDIRRLVSRRVSNTCLLSGNTIRFPDHAVRSAMLGEGNGEIIIEYDDEITPSSSAVSH